MVTSINNQVGLQEKFFFPCNKYFEELPAESVEESKGSRVILRSPTKIQTSKKINQAINSSKKSKKSTKFFFNSEIKKSVKIIN